MLMSPRLLAKLLHQLESSGLPPWDPVFLEVEAWLIEARVAYSGARTRGCVNVVALNARTGAPSDLESLKNRF